MDPIEPLARKPGHAFRRPGFFRQRMIPVRYLVPNLFTLLSLCAGVTAIRAAIEQRWELAVALIVAAALLDGVDGHLARALKAQSRFGAELDSLADFINFGVAPAIAPIVGGWLFVHLNWHSIFWFLTAVGVALWFANFKLLPETLHFSHRQPLKVSNLMQGYWQLGRDPRFVLLALASGVPFNGMFLYILSAPVFLGEHLALAPTQFFWFFVLSISGIMGGAWVSGRMAGKMPPKQQIKYGFLIMLLIALLNLGANLLFTARVSWAMFPIAIFSFGWAMMVPVVTLLVLDLHPARRGMASSLQAFVGSTANGLVAGVIAPLVMHSTVMLAAASLGMMCIGLMAWLVLRRRWPEIGQAVAHSAH